MPADSPRILELRRRVQADPASIAFAQLAEECRRVGANEEAVEICRAGLARNPGYLSARVTLGRALIELGQLDEAKAELDIVGAGVPNNLAAIRGLAEILQRRGEMKEALQYYKRALELAKHDPDLEDTVERISQAVAPDPAQHTAGPQVSIEEIFNFDTLIDQLGLPPELPAPPTPVEEAAPTPAFEDLFTEPPAELAVESPASADPPSLEELFAGPIAASVAEEPLEPVMLEEPAPVEDFFAEIPPEPAEEPAVILSSGGAELDFAWEIPVMLESASAAEARDGETSPELVEERPTSEAGPASQNALESVELSLDDADSLAVMERELRGLEQQRAHDEQRARAELGQRRRAAMIGALETGLSAIAADRERPGA